MNVNSWGGPWFLFVLFVFLCFDILKEELFVKRIQRIQYGPQLALLGTHLKLTGQHGFVLKTKVWSYQCFNSFLLRKEVVFVPFLGSSRYVRDPWICPSLQSLTLYNFATAHNSLTSAQLSWLNCKAARHICGKPGVVKLHQGDWNPEVHVHTDVGMQMKMEGNVEEGVLIWVLKRDSSH